jgi:hypothetical protein
MLGTKSAAGSSFHSASLSILRTHLNKGSVMTTGVRHRFIGPITSDIDLLAQTVADGLHPHPTCVWLDANGDVWASAEEHCEDLLPCDVVGVYAPGTHLHDIRIDLTEMHRERIASRRF